MPARRTIAIGAAAAIVALGGAATVTALDDPDESVDPVEIDDAASSGVRSPDAEAGASQQVPGLEELTGTVEQDDAGADDDDGNDDADDRADDANDDADDANDDADDDADDANDDADDGNDDADDANDDADDSNDDADDASDADDANDDDVIDLEINGVDLDFGPDDWVATADAAVDLDGDGTTAALRDELAGLVGQDVTMLVRFDDDGDDADVYVVGDVTYRDVTAAAPWLPADAADDETLRAAAAGAVGEGAEVVELDPEDDGDAAWEAKVRDADGTEHEVRLDASGGVIDVRDDD